MLFKRLFQESSSKWIKPVFLQGLPALSLGNTTAAAGSAELQNTQQELWLPPEPGRLAYRGS